MILVSLLNKCKPSVKINILNDLKFSVYQLDMFLQELSLFDVLLKYMQDPKCISSRNAGNVPSLTKEKFGSFIGDVYILLKSLQPHLNRYSLSKKIKVEVHQAEVLQICHESKQLFNASYLELFFMAKLKEVYGKQIWTMPSFYSRRFKKSQFMTEQVACLVIGKMPQKPSSWVHSTMIAWALTNLNKLIELSAKWLAKGS